MKRKIAVLLALALAAALLAGCGDDDSSATNDGTSAAATTDSGGSATEGQQAGEEGGEAGDEGADSGNGGQKLEFEVAQKGLAYTTEEVSIEAGPLTLELHNPQLEAHDLALDNSQGERVAQTYQISETSTKISGGLTPDTYTFYCTVQGHRKAGMEGTLTVE